MDSPKESSLFPQARVMIGWTALFILLVAGTFNYPLYPSADLDGSWRIALGYFFQKGSQFGKDVVFTYGPLGFAMGKTYSGLQFAAIIAAQLIFAMLGAFVIIHEGRRMTGLSRWAFFLGLLLFVITYEDAFHMLIIVLMGFQLLRGAKGRWGIIGLSLALAVLASIKFTNLMLAGLMITVTVAHALWRKRTTEATLISVVFFGGFLAVWILCGQNPLNLSDYFVSSWSISQGYTAAMGLSTPWSPLWKGFVVLAILGSYLLLHLKLNPDKPRALANATLLAGFIYLNWKHGFVRADGHMIGFFFCALLPLTAYPTLLDDPPRWRRLHFAFFIIGGFMSLWGIESALYGVVRSCAGIVQERIWKNIEWTFKPTYVQQVYHDKLARQKEVVNLTTTRQIVGRASLDVLGFEQATAIFNDFNYQPRPAIQSYSVFTPYLAKLNGDFYESNRAPEYLLLKIQTIDGRMPMMDDPEVWRLLPHRYDYLHSEKDYQLWHRLNLKFDPASATPTPLQATVLPLGEKLSLAPYAGKQLWTRIELKQTLLGRLHAFLYKPPQVKLALVDQEGMETKFYLPLTQGRAGFILSPIIEDAVAYVSFAANRPGREVRSLSLLINPGDRYLFADTARIEISELQRAHAAENYFKQQIAQTFPMFRSYPFQYTAHAKLTAEMIGDQLVAVLHAPSEMIYNLPTNAQEITGSLGFLPGAYTTGANTDGAEFIITWSNGVENAELFRRFLDPMHVTTDQGPQAFKIPLGQLSGGRLNLRIDSGPNGNYSWDWTYWTNIEIK